MSCSQYESYLERAAIREDVMYVQAFFSPLTECAHTAQLGILHIIEALIYIAESEEKNRIIYAQLQKICERE